MTIAQQPHEGRPRRLGLEHVAGLARTLPFALPLFPVAEQAGAFEWLGTSAGLTWAVAAAAFAAWAVARSWRDGSTVRGHGRRHTPPSHGTQPRTKRHERSSTVVFR